MPKKYVPTERLACSRCTSEVTKAIADRFAAASDAVRAQYPLCTPCARRLIPLRRVARFVCPCGRRVSMGILERWRGIAVDAGVPKDVVGAWKPYCPDCASEEARSYLAGEAIRPLAAAALRPFAGEAIRQGGIALPTPAEDAPPSS